jgi:hypothetical protein
LPNPLLVLLLFLVALVLTTVGVLIVARVGQVAMRGLGLELYGVLLWLGLAEASLDEMSARRQRAPAGERSLGKEIRPSTS